MQEIFEDNVELSEDEVVMLMFQETENSLKECQVEYRKLAMEAGLIVSPAQRKEEWEGVVAELDISTEEGLSAAKAAGKDAGITGVTTSKYLKAMAEEQGIELPVTVRSTKWTEVVAAFEEDEALNGDKADVIAKIGEVGDYDEKKATGLYNKLRRAFGWTAPASMASQLSDWFVDNLDADKESIVEKAIELGMTDGSATYYLGVFKIVKELLVELESRN